MTTSNVSTSADSPEAVATERVPLRMQMTADSSGVLAGAWWPQTRDLGVELADLVDHFPPELGRINRAVFSPPDWLPPPRRIPIARGFLKVGSFPRDDTHVIVLMLADGRRLPVMVVPSTASAGEAEQAMQAATSADNRLTAPDILASSATPARVTKG